MILLIVTSVTVAVLATIALDPDARRRLRVRRSRGVHPRIADWEQVRETALKRHGDCAWPSPMASAQLRIVNKANRRIRRMES